MTHKKHTKKILIVDDDTVFVKTLGDYLHNLGYEIFVAEDGQAGLLTTEKESPDLIVLDLVMPKLGGIDFLKTLHKDSDMNKTPVLITSNFSGSDKVNEGMEYGVRGFIVKSNESLKTIGNAIESIIGVA
jgi:DNA-binding response OmpR family regulator